MPRPLDPVEKALFNGLMRMEVSIYKERVLERIAEVQSRLLDLDHLVRSNSAAARAEAVALVGEAAALAAEVRLWQHLEVDKEQVPR